jgi:hypothetical protein
MALPVSNQFVQPLDADVDDAGSLFYCSHKLRSKRNRCGYRSLVPDTRRNVVTQENNNNRTTYGSGVEVVWIGIAVAVALIVVCAIYWGDLGTNTASNGPAVNSETTGSTRGR